MAATTKPKITKAVEHPEWYELTLVDVDETGTVHSEPYFYVLRVNDPYGDAPFLTDQLNWLVSNGDIVIEQPGGTK